MKVVKQESARVTLQRLSGQWAGGVGWVEPRAVTLDLRPALHRLLLPRTGRERLAHLLLGWGPNPQSKPGLFSLSVPGSPMGEAAPPCWGLL